MKNALLDGAILPTLLWLAWPNVIALSAGTCVVIAEAGEVLVTGASGFIGRRLLPALTRGNDSTFYLKDIYVDTVSNLPTRIGYSGPAADFVLDYTVIENHWVINRAHYRATAFGPLHIGQTTFTTDASYSAFTFPTTPADPRLK